jgi:uncharacterized membrane protein YeaQ/YmgE (transglycosylase-associated protein family)
MIMYFLWFILIGLAAGWLAGQITKRGSYGLVGDLLLGIVGAVIGGFLFRLVGFRAVGLLAQLISATVGAVILIAGLRAINKSEGGS